MENKITKEELTNGKEVAAEHTINFEVLYFKMNLLRYFYGKPMVITSGYRTKEDQIRIYNEKGIKDPPMRSKHLLGMAADVFDPTGSLKKWIKDNESLVISIGFWMEHFDYTATWCHLQIIPPKSGSRYFIP